MATSPATPEPPVHPPAPPVRSVLRSFLRRALGLVLWGLGTVFALLIAGLVALWIWAGTAGSLAQTLAWAQDWLQGRSESLGQLQVEGAEGSLRGGGRIASLHWTQDGLKVQADGVQLDWNDSLWIEAAFGRGVHPAALAVQHLRVTDTRAPTPSEPMESLVLPLPISLAFRVDSFELAGNTELKLSKIEGHYSYRPLGGSTPTPTLPDTTGLTEVHQLSLDALRFADGRYQAQLSLGAQAPMPLALALQGTVDAQVPDGAAVQATLDATASGTLSGPQATLDIAATAIGQPATPEAGTSRLEAQGRVMPWAAQPVLELQAQAQTLNLAAFWPSAPKTDLSGELKAAPEGDRWLAQLQLNNGLAGPADQQGLPLHSLQASVVQEGDRWTVSDLLATLSGGGEVRGEGRFRLDTSGEQTALLDWQGELQARRVQPALLWSTLAPGALDASLSAREAPGERQPAVVNLQASVQASARQPKGTALAGLRLKELRLRGQWQPATASGATGQPAPPASAGLLDLQEAHLDLAGAQLRSQGRFDTRSLRFDGRLDLQLPGARLDWRGLVAHDQGQGKAQLQVDSAERVLAWVRSLQDLPFAGPPIQAALGAQAGLAVSGRASAELAWQGGLGALGFPAPEGNTAQPAWPTLQARVQVPQLKAQTGAGEEGGDIELNGIDLQVDGPPSLVQLSARGNATAAGWRVALDSAGQWRAAPVVSEGGQLTLSQLALRLTPPKTPPAGEAATVTTTTTDTSATAQGFALKSRQPLVLAWTTRAGQGMALDAGAGELQLTPLNTGPDAPPEPLTLAWQRLVWQAQALETQGRLQGLSLPWIASLAAIGQPPGPGPLAGTGLSGDLVLDGAWNVRVPADTGTPLELFATVQRRSGDLRWQATTTNASGATTPGSAPVAAGVKDAHISLNVKDGQAQALLRWDTERLGRASADLSTTLNPTPANDDTSAIDRWWPARTPVRGTAQLRLPEVGVWSMFTPPGWRMNGTLQAEATLSGTRGQPEWRGKVQGDQLALRSVVDGFAFTNGQLRATLDGERIQVDRFSLQGPGGAESGGTLEASGQAEWRAVPDSLVRQPFIELKARAERLRVSNRADRRVTVSGDLSAQLAGPRLQLRGQLKADSALIILPDELAPSLSEDVVVRSTRTLPSEPEDGQRVLPDVQVSLDLGPRFEVRGQGMQTRLEGQITVRATPTLPTPRALGEVRLVSGTYRAYGQQLNIETGILRFTGPYDDPALDILAVRKLPRNVEQRVGVQITGNAQAPRIALFAEPDLPDADKLAWLVLGRPASAAGAQAFVLQQAARKLLSGSGEPDDEALAKALGLDEVGFAGPSSNADGTTTDAALTLGKRLSSDLYLSYEQSLAGAMSTVSILYDLSKRLTLRARAGTENAIDLIFTHRYE